MKLLKFLFPVLLCTLLLGLSSSKDLPGNYPNGNLSDFRTRRKPVHRNGVVRPADL